MAPEITAELKNVGSHHIKLGFNHDLEKEELFFYFRSTWRGEAVMFTVSADRYRHSSGLSEWRIYARDARKVDPEMNGERGFHLTDLARRRLGEVGEPIAEQWLTTDDYKASRRVAFVSAVRRIAADAGGYANPPSRDIMAAMTKNLAEFTAADVESIISVADAFDAYKAALDRLA